MFDGHDRCPSCLGMEHLEAALSNPCPECSIIPLERRQLRLSSAFPNTSRVLATATGKQRGTKRGHSEDREHSKSKRRASSTKLAKRMDELTSTVQKLQALLADPSITAVEDHTDQAGGVAQFHAHTLPLPDNFPDMQPQDTDALSVAATDSLFAEPHGQPPMDAMLAPSQRSSLHSTSGSEPDTGSKVFSAALSLCDNINMALAKLKLDLPQAPLGPTNLLCRSVPGAKRAQVPHCKDFTEVVSTAFQSALTFRPDRAARMLADMSSPDATGLGSMPAVEPCVASLIVSPDEALRQDVRCPNKECRRTDDALVKTYNTVARL